MTRGHIKERIFPREKSQMDSLSDQFSHETRAHAGETTEQFTLTHVVQMGLPSYPLLCFTLGPQPVNLVYYPYLFSPVWWWEPCCSKKLLLSVIFCSHFFLLFKSQIWIKFFLEKARQGWKGSSVHTLFTRLIFLAFLLTWISSAWKADVFF